MRGDRLRLLREEKDLTQAALAEHLETTEVQVWRYEKGSAEPRADVVVRIAQFFGVSTDYLMGLTDHPGVKVDDELSIQERAVLAAWRRGDRLKAIQVIAGDE